MPKTNQSQSIRITCSCGLSGKVPCSYAGRRIRCKCGADIRIPSWVEPSRPYKESRRKRQEQRRRDESPNALWTSDPWDRDLELERHVAAVGFWYQLGAVLGGLFTVFSFLTLLGAAPVAAAITLFVSAGLAGFSFHLGSSLRAFRGWARWVVVALNALALVLVSTGFALAPLKTAVTALGFVIGVTWHGAIVVLLLSSTVAALFTPRYRKRVRATEVIKPPMCSSPFFYMPLLTTAGVLLLGLVMMRWLLPF